MTLHTFHCPTRLHLGRDARHRVPDLLRGRTLIVCTPGQWARLQADAEPWWPRGAAVFAEVTPNPDLDALDAAADALRGRGIEGVLAIGGGSAMDAGKALAALLGGGGSLHGWFREGEPVPETGWLPLVAVATTAGTGSEVTPFATIWDTARMRKRSLSGPAAFPAEAVVDPVLMASMPQAVTRSTGLDALNQALESVWSRGATPWTEALAARAAGLAMAALPEVLERPGDLDARHRMAEASVLAGVCIAQTRTALCHAISYPLTLHFGTPHGLACAFSMQAVWSVCAAADDGRLARLAHATGHGSVASFGAALAVLLERCGLADALAETLPRDPAALLALVGEMHAPGRSDNLMVPVTEGVLAEVVGRSMAAA